MKQFKTLAMTILAIGILGTEARADWFAPINAANRCFGWGWSDGYHASTRGMLTPIPYGPVVSDYAPLPRWDFRETSPTPAEPEFVPLSPQVSPANVQPPDVSVPYDPAARRMQPRISGFSK